MKDRIVLMAASLPNDMTGGMQVQAEATARELARVFDVVVLARALQLPPGVERVNGYTVIRKRVIDVPGVRLVADVAQSLWHLWRLPSVRALLCYQTLSGGMIGVLAGRLLGIPVLVSIRSEEEYRLAGAPWPLRRLSRVTWRMAERVLVQSARLRSDFLGSAAARGLDLETRTTVVPNGTQVGPVETAPDRPERLITVARLHPKKGIPVLMEALRGLAETERPELVLIGDGPLAGQLRAAATDLPVSFGGAMSHTEVQSQLAQGGIFVLPSIEEGTPNVLLEALAHGLPVVATSVGGVPDLISDGENGMLVRAGDAGALQCAVQRVRQDDDLRERLRAAGPATASAFSFEALGRRLETEIRQVTTRSVPHALDRLTTYLERRYLEHGALSGPDPSGRINLRLGRFLPVPQRPKVFLQSVGYWARLNNLRGASDHVRASGDFLLERQRADGAFPYTDGSGRVATFDGTWAAIGLLEAYWATRKAQYAEGSARWLEYLLRNAIRPHGRGQYVQYWSELDLVVPNVSAELLWLASEQAKVERSAALEELMPGLLRFLGDAQIGSGELPYRLANSIAPRRQHYLCYQYNAFQFLAIARYAENTADAQSEPLLAGLEEFLVHGQAPSGGCRTSCHAAYPEVDYYTAALALALRRAERFAGARPRLVADALVSRLLTRQHRDGRFGYSSGDYGIGWLRDGHGYPRPLAIIAYTLGVLGALDTGRAEFGTRLQGLAL